MSLLKTLMKKLFSSLLSSSRRRLQQTTDNQLSQPRLTLCPCCGARFDGSLAVDGCTNCGARQVGEPLARPAACELPHYGRSLFALACGVNLIIVFLAATLMRAFERGANDFWAIVAASETAAWQLKYVWLPLTVVAAFLTARLYKTVCRNQVRFGGARLAGAGAALSVAAFVLGIMLVGVTIPERLRQRRLAAQAHNEAVLYQAAAVLLEYSARYGTLPGEIEDLRKLPDTDGRVAQVIANFSDAEAYTPASSMQASAAKAATTKPQRRGNGNLRSTAAVAATAMRARNISFKSAAPDVNDGVTFTNYDLVWAGADGIIGTDDDRALRDGLLVAAKTKSAAKSEAKAYASPTSNANKKNR